MRWLASAVTLVIIVASCSAQGSRGSRRFSSRLSSSVEEVTDPPVHRFTSRGSEERDAINIDSRESRKLANDAVPITSRNHHSRSRSEGVPRDSIGTPIKSSGAVEYERLSSSRAGGTRTRSQDQTHEDESRKRTSRFQNVPIRERSQFKTSQTGSNNDESKEVTRQSLRRGNAVSEAAISRNRASHSETKDLGVRPTEVVSNSNPVTQDPLSTRDHQNNRRDQTRRDEHNGRSLSHSRRNGRITFPTGGDSTTESSATPNFRNRFTSRDSASSGNRSQKELRKHSREPFRSKQELPPSTVAPLPTRVHQTTPTPSIDVTSLQQNEEKPTSSPKGTGVSSRGNTNRGSARGPQIHVDKVTDDVDESDNYPEVYKQLKKSGTAPKDILALIKSKKKIRDAQQHSVKYPVSSPAPPADKTSSSSRDTERLNNRSAERLGRLYSRQNSKSTDMSGGSDIYSRRHNRFSPPNRALKSRLRPEEPQEEKENDRFSNENNDEREESAEETAKDNGAENTTHKPYSHIPESAPKSTAHPSRFAGNSRKEGGWKKVRKVLKPYGGARNVEQTDLNEPENENKDSSSPTEDNFEKEEVNSPEVGPTDVQSRASDQSRTRQSFTEEVKSPKSLKYKHSRLQEKLEPITEKSPDAPIKTDHPKYIPRSRSKEYEKFKARTKANYESTTEESLKPKYPLYKETELNGPISSNKYEKTRKTAPAVRPTYIPPRKRYVKSSTTPIPIARYRARKASKYNNPEVLQTDNTEKYAYEQDDELLLHGLNGLSIDSLVSESEHSSISSDTLSMANVATKTPRYKGESHIQRVPLKKKSKQAQFVFPTTAFLESLAHYQTSEIPLAPTTEASTEGILKKSHITFEIDIPTEENSFEEVTDIPLTNEHQVTESQFAFSVTNNAVNSTTETPVLRSSHNVTEPTTSIQPSIETTTKATQKPTTKATQKPTTKATQKPTTKPTQKPTTKATQKPTTKATQKPTTKATQKPTTKTTQKPTTKATQRPTSQEPTEKPTTETTQAPTTKATQKPTTKATQKPTTKATQKPTTKATQKPTPKPTTKATQKPTPKPTTKATQKPTPKPATKPTPKATQKPTLNTTGLHFSSPNHVRNSLTEGNVITNLTTETTLTSTLLNSPDIATNLIRETRANSSENIIPISDSPTLATTEKTNVLTHPPVDITYRGNLIIEETRLNSQEPISSTTTASVPQVVTILSTIAQLAQNLTASTTPDYSNTARIRSYTSLTSESPPTTQNTPTNYVVYGLLPNNKLVRKVMKTTPAPVDIPFIIYGLYPNGTIVRRYPNGTILPDEVEEENEVVANVDPSNRETLENAVKKDNPLSYLYPPGLTTPPTTPSTSTPAADTKVMIHDNAARPNNPLLSSRNQNIDELSSTAATEKIVEITPTTSPALATTTKSSIETTSVRTTTEVTATSTAATPTSTKPPTKKTNKTTTKPTTKPKTKTTTKPTTVKPTTKQTTVRTTPKPTTTRVTAKPTTAKPTMKPTAAKPTTKPTTAMPTTKPTTAKPTTKPTTAKPTTKPTTAKPTTKPTTAKPTTKPTTAKPRVKQTTVTTTTKPTTTRATAKASTAAPTTKATTMATTVEPTTNTAAKSTMKATTAMSKAKPTTKPTPKRTPAKSSNKPVTKKPTTPKPVSKHTTSKSSTKPTPAKQKNKATTINLETKISPSTKNKETDSKITTTTSKVTTAEALSTTTASPVNIVEPNLVLMETSKEQDDIDKMANSTPSDFELLNDLLRQEKDVNPSVENDESEQSLANKVIQLAIEKATKKSNALPSQTTQKTQPLVPKLAITEDTSSPAVTNKTGKISVWVLSADDNSTALPPSENSITPSDTNNDLKVLDTLLSTPGIENLSVNEQLLLADVLSSTAFPAVTERKPKKKKKPKPTTTTTPAPPRLFPILRALFSRGRVGNGRGLFGGGGLRGLLNPDAGRLDSESTTAAGFNSQAAFGDDLDPPENISPEIQVDPQTQQGLVGAAINVTRAVSQFMGYVIQYYRVDDPDSWKILDPLTDLQSHFSECLEMRAFPFWKFLGPDEEGATQSFQNYLQSRTRNLAQSLTYPVS